MPGVYDTMIIIETGKLNGTRLVEYVSDPLFLAQLAPVIRDDK